VQGCAGHADRGCEGVGQGCLTQREYMRRTFSILHSALSKNPVISVMVSWMCNNAKDVKTAIDNTLRVSLAFLVKLENNNAMAQRTKVPGCISLGFSIVPKKPVELPHFLKISSSLVILVLSISSISLIMRLTPSLSSISFSKHNLRYQRCPAIPHLSYHKIFSRCHHLLRKHNHTFHTSK